MFSLQIPMFHALDRPFFFSTLYAAFVDVYAGKSRFFDSSFFYI